MWVMARDPIDRVRDCLRRTPGRRVHATAQMERVLETFFVPRNVWLIQASVPYRQSPLRAMVPLIGVLVEDLVHVTMIEFEWTALKARQYVHRALSEMMRIVCDELDMVPSKKTAQVGHALYHRGAVYVFRED